MALHPTGIIALELAAIGNPPDMIASARLGDVARFEPAAERALKEGDCLQHGAAAGTAAADIVDLARAGATKVFDEATHEIARVDVVANLLALMTDHIVGAAGSHASREV